MRRLPLVATGLAVTLGLARRLPLVSLPGAVILALAGVLFYGAFNWPSDWEGGAQATLAAALIAPVGAILSVALKWYFDERTLVIQHRLDVQSRMLERFYEYAGHYVMPLAAAACETARYLDEYAKETGERRVEKLDCAFYSLAQYVRLHATLKHTFSLPNVDPPLGILMSSHKAEDRIWQITPPPWVFGVGSLAAESILVGALTGKDGKLRPAEAFIESAHDGKSPLHRIQKDFAAHVASDTDFVADVARVLYALNLIINYELGRVYAPWYKDSAEDPKDRLKTLEDLPPQRKERLGIFQLPLPNPTAADGSPRTD